jgi:hypothetical protein
MAEIAGFADVLSKRHDIRGSRTAGQPHARFGKSLKVRKSSGLNLHLKTLDQKGPLVGRFFDDF